VVTVKSVFCAVKVAGPEAGLLAVNVAIFWAIVLAVASAAAAPVEGAVPLPDAPATL